MKKISNWSKATLKKREDRKKEAIAQGEAAKKPKRVKKETGITGGPKEK